MTPNINQLTETVLKNIRATCESALEGLDINSPWDAGYNEGQYGIAEQIIATLDGAGL